jgi:hypothetical protein
MKEETVDLTDKTVRLELTPAEVNVLLQVMERTSATGLQSMQAVLALYGKIAAAVQQAAK